MNLSLDIVESLKIAWNAIIANKARGVLTMLGIIIGIVAVTTTMTAFNGMQAAFRQGAGAIGADVIYVSRMPWVMMNDFFLYRNRPNLELDDALALEDAFRGRAIVNTTTNTSRDLRYQSNTLSNVTILGTTEKFTATSGMMPETGRFLTEFENRFKKHTAIIGSEIAQDLFGSINPINKQINVGRYRYRIAGVMEEQGGTTFGGPNFDRQVYIPISTFVNDFGSRRVTDVDIAVKSPEIGSIDDLEYEVIGEMRKIRKLRPSEPENFSINKLDSLLGAFNSIVGAVLGIGLLVTSIALFVGGIGVMNIMFVSVTERTREIGIRKAIGAKRRSILMQFLFESAAICLIGGLIGIGLAAMITLAINATGLVPASLSTGIMVTSVVVAILVGVFAGLVPAWKGAKLDPIEALRYE